MTGPDYLALSLALAGAGLVGLGLWLWLRGRRGPLVGSLIGLGLALIGLLLAGRRRRVVQDLVRGRQQPDHGVADEAVREVQADREAAREERREADARPDASRAGRLGRLLGRTRRPPAGPPGRPGSETPP